MVKLITLAIAIGVAFNLSVAYLSSPGAFEDFSWIERPGFLATGLCLAFVPWFTNALKLVVWSSLFDRTLSFPGALRIVIGTELAQSVSPTTVGGAPLKLALLLEEGYDAGRSTVLTMMSSIENFLFFATTVPAIFFLARAWEYQPVRNILDLVPVSLRGVSSSALAVVGFLLFVVGLLLYRFGGRISGRATRKLRKFTKSVSDGFASVGTTKGLSRLGVTWLIGFPQWSARYSVVTFVALGLGLPVDPLLFPLLQWVTFSAGLLVPTPGAAVGVEGAFALLFAPLIPGSLLGLVTAIWRFVTFYLVLMVGLPLFLLLSRTRSSALSREPAVGIEVGTEAG